MRRRDFLASIGATVLSPFSATAQQTERMRHIAVLVSALPSDPEYPLLLDALRRRLQELGWNEGQNLRVDVRWGGGGPDAIYNSAMELVALAPDLIVAAGGAATGPALRATRTVPVVFTIVPDPVGAGFVESLARPGGNATGFTSFDYGIGGKWLGLLKEVAPGIKRVGVLRDANVGAGIGQWSAIQAVAPILGIEAQSINLRGPTELEQALADFGRSPDGGLIITSGAGPVRHRALIVRLAAAHKLPAIYYAKVFATAGGLVSYGANRTDLFRRAADYADRVLKGEKPAELPVQAPSTYELVVNLQAARDMRVVVPASLLARADEVIE